MIAAALLIPVLFLPACGPGRPRAIAFGEELCTRCHMPIMDARFSAQALSGTGKTYAFDDVGCLAAWMTEHNQRAVVTWVWGFVEGSGWLPAEEAVYLRTDSLRTPMASGLAAVRPGREADSVRGALGGVLLSWPEVLRGTPPHVASATD